MILPRLQDEAGVDLADFLNTLSVEKEGRIEELWGLMRNAPNFIEFQIHATQQMEGKHRREKTKTILGFLSGLDPLDQNYYLDVMTAAELGSKGALRRQLEKHQGSPEKASATRTAHQIDSIGIRWERDVYEAEDHYFKRKEAGNGTSEEISLSSFIIKPKLRVWVDSRESIQCDLKTSRRPLRKY